MLCILYVFMKQPEIKRFTIFTLHKSSNKKSKVLLSCSDVKGELCRRSHRCWGVSKGDKFEPLAPASGDLKQQQMQKSKE